MITAIDKNYYEYLDKFHEFEEFKFTTQQS